jgi:chemotaxis protein methyltransferase CheR
MTALAISAVAPASGTNDHFVLSERAFEAIRTIVLETAGISLSASKRDLVRARLVKRLRANACADFEDYLALLRGSGGDVELGELIRAITTNVTHFNRESHHFVHFRDVMVPAIRQAVDANRPVRIWSAGCSDGREAYTIGSFLLEALPGAQGRDVRILATDIDTNMLRIGMEGRYPRTDASKLPAELLDRWFEKDGDWVVASDALRKIIAFRELNLISNWPMRQRYHAIFCRNVMIYFAPELQAELISRFSTHLLPGGYLYLGHSERLHGPAAKLFTPQGVTVYQKSAGAEK